MLDVEQLDDLNKYLEKLICQKDYGCDKSLRLTKRWLKKKNVNKPATVLWQLEKFGGYCDCGVVLNVTGPFLSRQCDCRC